MSNKRQHFYWSSIILVLLVGGIGCSKPGATLNFNPVAYISIMDLAPYDGPVDVYLSGTLVSPSGGIAPGQFSTQYGQLKPGSYPVDFKKAGTDSLLAEIPAAVYDTLNLYTLVLYNTAPGSAAVSAARIQDNISQVNPSNSYYRFFNMCPDAPSVDLYMNGMVAQTSRMPADNIGNSTYNSFQAVPPGDYTLQVQKAATDTVLGTPQSNYPFAAGYVYTIFLTGTTKAMSVTVLPLVY